MNRRTFISRLTVGLMASHLIWEALSRHRPTIESEEEFVTIYESWTQQYKDPPSFIRTILLPDGRTLQEEVMAKPPYKVIHSYELLGKSFIPPQ